MKTDAPPAGTSHSESSNWPACAMLSYGTFGKQTPAGRRYHIRAAIAVAAIVVLLPAAALLAKHFPNTPWLAIQSLAPGFAFAYIAWEFRRYLLSLDELARHIQFEATAWTYLTGLVIAALVGGVAMAYGLQWDRLWLNPFWFILLEPVRAGFLYYVARRY
jgi:hypothetical protein